MNSKNRVLCPLCGSPMLIKRARKGSGAGKQFYGCVGYPECRGTKSLSPIKKSFIEDDSSIKMDPDTKEYFLNLVRYYKECVQMENLSDIVFRQTNEGTEFIQCPSEVEWLSSEKEIFEIKGNAVSKFGSRSRWRRSLSYYYAYPIYIQRFKRRRSRWEEILIKPLMIFPVEVNKDLDSLEISRVDFSRPQINTSVLSSPTFYARPEYRKNFVQKILELWDEEDSNEKNFQKIIKEMTQEFGEIQYLKNGNIYSEKLNLKRVETGFYSTGILFVTQGSTYTYGLEEELQSIEDGLAGDVGQMPIIDSIINRKQKSSETPKDDIIEILPLNDEQREAVASAFKNDLSIITGPPGTGKSQVVINIIANAVAKGESVLFGSKNHQAVDVVLDRIYKIQKEPVILKFGQSSKESVFAEKLLASADKTLILDPEELESEINSLKGEIDEIFEEEERAWQEIRKCYETRDKINRIEKELDDLEPQLPISVKEYFDEIKLIDIDKKLRNRLADLLKIYNKKLFKFGSFLLSIIGITPAKRICRILNRVPTAAKLPEAAVQYFKCNHSETDEIENKAQALINTIDYNSLLRKNLNIQQSSDATTKKLQELKDKIIKLQEERCYLSPQYVDCISKKRFMKLSSRDRGKISDYVSTLKRIERDRIGGEVVKNLRKEKEKLFKSVVNAFPALAVTNLSVRHVVPMNIGAIDLVVIDEASQCDIASAIPMLVRAKRAVIIGDDRQLIHVSNISQIGDQQIQQKYGLTRADEQRFLYSTYSLFDLCKTTVGTSGAYVMLQDHYRSRKEIIEFSNKYFYGDSLRVWTDYRKLKKSGEDEGIRWHDVKGKVVQPAGGSVHNVPEARAVIDVLEEIIPKALEEKATIGIVTPFRAQENKIKKLLMESVDIEYIEALDIKIDTAHGYQGDERDIIIFSLVISSGMEEKTKRFLSNTQNLFNVAVTRTRSQLIIVGDREACETSKIEHLENFADYVERLQIDIKKKPIHHEAVFDSIWEEIFYNRLKEIGINTVPQYAVHQYKIDLAVENNVPPIAIEIDGEVYHRDITGQRCMSDIKRDIRLDSMGWYVKRFWVYELKYDMEKCVNEIKSLINK